MFEDNGRDKTNLNDSGKTVNDSPATEDNDYIPPPVYAPAAPVAESKSDTLGILGLIFGIVGILTACCWPLGILLGATALVCGIVAKSREQRLATAGIVLGIITLLFAVFFLVLGRIMADHMPYFLNEFIYRFEHY